VKFAPNNEIFADGPGTGFRWQITPGDDGAAPILAPLELSTPPGFTSLCLVSNRLVWTSERGSQIVPLEQLDAGDRAWVRTAPGMNAVSPNGEWLAIFRGRTRLVHMYRLPGLEPVATLTNELIIRHIEFSPRGDEIAVACRQGLEFWSTRTWQRTRHLPQFNSILYSPDGLTFWLSEGLRAAGLYHARTAEPILPLPAGAIPLAVSPDGHKLALSMDTRRVQVWNLAELRDRLRELRLDWRDDPLLQSPPAE
jgi:hypothetical protein